jgi:hypothetical protein
MKKLALKDVKWAPGNYAVVKQEHHKTRVVRIHRTYGRELYDENECWWVAETGKPVSPMLTTRGDPCANQPRIVGLADTDDLLEYGTPEQKAASIKPLVLVTTPKPSGKTLKKLMMPLKLLDKVTVGSKYWAHHPDGSPKIPVYAALLTKDKLIDHHAHEWYRATGTRIDAKVNSPVVMEAGEPFDTLLIGEVEVGDQLVIQCKGNERYSTAVLKIEASKVMSDDNLEWGREKGDLLSQVPGKRGRQVTKVIRKGLVGTQPAPAEALPSGTDTGKGQTSKPTSGPVKAQTKIPLTPTVAELRLRAALEAIEVGDSIQLKDGSVELVSTISVTEGKLTKFTTGEPPTATAYTTVGVIDQRIARVIKAKLKAVETGPSMETLHALKTIKIGDFVKLSNGALARVTGNIVADGRVASFTTESGIQGGYRNWTASTGYIEGRFMQPPWVVKVIRQGDVSEAAAKLLTELESIEVGDTIQSGEEGGDVRVTCVVKDPHTGKVTSFKTADSTTYHVEAGIDGLIAGVIKAEAPVAVGPRLALFDGVKAGDRFEVLVPGSVGYTITVSKVFASNLFDTSGREWSLKTGFLAGMQAGPCIVAKVPHLELFDGVKVGDQFEVLIGDSRGDARGYTIMVADIATHSLNDTEGRLWSMETGCLAGRTGGPCITSKVKVTEPGTLLNASPEVIKALEAIQSGAVIKLSNGKFEKVIGTVLNNRADGKVVSFSTDGPEPCDWVSATGRHLEDTPGSPTIVEVLPVTSSSSVITSLQTLAVGDSVKLSDVTTETVTGIVASDCKTHSFTTDRAESGKYWTNTGRRHGDHSDLRVIQVIKKGWVSQNENKPSDGDVVAPAGSKVGDSFVVTEQGLVPSKPLFSLGDITLREFVTTLARWIRG